MNAKELTVLMVEPGKHPKVTKLKDDLDSLQRADLFSAVPAQNGKSPRVSNKKGDTGLVVWQRNQVFIRLSLPFRYWAGVWPVARRKR
jgi:hypothetical protein